MSNPSYSNDADGNMTQGAGSSINWMSFDMVNTIIRGGQSSSLCYGPEHRRVRRIANYNGSNITTWYGDSFEFEVNK